MDNVVAEGLTKRFGDRTVVDSVDLRVPSGTIYGFLGQNGAGKSTTIKMLCGLLPATSGRMEVCGHDVAREPLEVKRAVGYMPEEIHTYERLTGWELLCFTGRMFGLSRDDCETRARDLLEFMEFSTDDRHRLVVDYSMGMKKKITLGCALIHNPRVMFLDEPFNGIDAVSCRLIRGALVQAADRGMTIFFSSHVLEVVEKLCHEIAILSQGRLQATGTVDSIRREHGYAATAPLEEIFVDLVGGGAERGELQWIR